MASEIFNPGTMRFNIVLQAPQLGRGTDGSVTKTWGDIAPVKAAIDFGTGREFFAAKQVQADITHMVTIYTCPGLATTWRIRFDDAGTIRFFDIRGIAPKGTMRRYQALACRELVGREAQS